MRRTHFTFILLNALLLGTALILAKTLEYRYYRGHMTLEFYLGITALAFLGVGVWLARAFGKRASTQAKAHSPIAPKQTVPPQPPIDPLTARERELLALLARGHTNKELAEEAHLSVNTVKTHLRNMFAKLEVRNRTEAVAKARALNLVDPDHNPTPPKADVNPGHPAQTRRF